MRLTLMQRVAKMVAEARTAQGYSPADAMIEVGFRYENSFRRSEAEQLREYKRGQVHGR